MSEQKWIKVRADFESALKHFGMSKKISDTEDLDEDSLHGYAARMALMRSLSIGYTALESGLKRTLKVIGEALPIGDEWQHDLLKRAAMAFENDRPAIISKETYQLANKVRRFRTIAYTRYNEFVPAKSKNALEAAEELSKAIMPELEQFISIIDPKMD